MIKIVEQEIEEYLKGFSKRDIIMNLKGVIIAEIKMINARCVYHRSIGILEINNGQIKFEINTSFLYKMGISYNGKIIRMFFDNGIDVTFIKSMQIA